MPETPDNVSRTYIVTGGTGGIGFAVARQLCAGGHHVVVTDRADMSEEQRATLAALPGTMQFERCDIAEEAAVEAMVAAAVAAKGQLHGAVNCAGVEQGMVALADMELSMWERTIRINLTGMFLCLKHQIRAMLESGGGSIVNIGSALGTVALANGCEYVASKHGVSGLTKAAALDYATQGIRVNAVMPGVIKTPMHERHAHEPWMADFSAAMKVAHPIGRMGESDEVAASVLWLLSDASSFVTGSLMAVDGGFTTH